MLIRVVALAVFAAVATVDVCAAPSDGAAEPAEAQRPVAPWLVLLKPEGDEETTPLLRENAGAIDPGPGQRYSWQSLTATLGFIAQALARIPIVWITGNASATSLPPQRVSVVPVALPEPTAAAAVPPPPSTAPAPAAAPAKIKASALDDFRDTELLPEEGVITDVDVDESGIAVAQVFDDGSAMGEGWVPGGILDD